MSIHGGRTAAYRFLGVITVAYITFQLVSDVTAGKLTMFWRWPGSVGLWYFPITYILSDILTEVYGYAIARRVLWQVMAASITAGVIYQFVVLLPPAPGFDANAAYARVFGVVPRILFGGWIAVFAGDVANNYTLARMKVWTRGRYLWTRTIGSTIVGEGINTMLFYLIGLYGIMPSNLLLPSILSGWAIKTVIETVMTPVTYAIVNGLKKAENEDYFDRDTNFSPFTMKV